MTVKELREKLAEYPPDMKVFSPDDKGFFDPISVYSLKGKITSGWDNDPEGKPWEFFCGWSDWEKPDEVLIIECEDAWK